ncbi:hypothetical protein BZA05DRAFT_198801 [Tricharina praecox]|uniref:uncharacterized protein n=1 Tax=Tricharina praecox TaxID=43433 RepID=UPI0022201BAF|nr:uncharacterized protein BZA05DRAFT_198801 [Tricharina praecox]KAI5856350.1 hypothetical protein BZA05DRAFT_198801 [Tricharina praecox]
MYCQQSAWLTGDRSFFRCPFPFTPSPRLHLASYTYTHACIGAEPERAPTAVSDQIPRDAQVRGRDGTRKLWSRLITVLYLSDRSSCSDCIGLDRMSFSPSSFTYQPVERVTEIHSLFYRRCCGNAQYHSSCEGEKEDSDERGPRAEENTGGRDKKLDFLVELTGGWTGRELDYLVPSFSHSLFPSALLSVFLSFFLSVGFSGEGSTVVAPEEGCAWRVVRGGLSGEGWAEINREPVSSSRPASGPRQPGGIRHVICHALLRSNAMMIKQKIVVCFLFVSCSFPLYLAPRSPHIFDLMIC